jgi:glyoxylase-like metal-dependent hydrolase (beta-lactamase superfamily II)
MTTTGASVHVVHEGYVRRGGRVAGTIVLVLDGEARIVVDPGMIAARQRILDPLRAHGVEPGDVTHVFLSHHHPDHTLNVALFPNAEVVDFWARYRDDLWLDHEGDGHRISPNAEVWLTPGHTEEDASLVVRALDGTYAMTHLWWHGDRTPAIDPLAWDQDALERSRARLLEAVDVVVPGHGAPFRVER